MNTATRAPPLNALCINLDSRPDRWTETQTAFQGSGITLERLSAVRHKVGWKGCGTSHVAVVRKAKEAGWPWMLLVEDDCELSADFATRWPAIRDALWADRGRWDIYLGGPRSVDGPVDVHKSGLMNISWAYSTHFTVINASAYDTILAWIPDKDGPIDFFYANELRIITAPPPMLATQRPSFSDIEGKKKDYNADEKGAELALTKFYYTHQTRAGTIGLVALSAAIVGAILFYQQRRRF